jgi:hypothetical protein
MQLFLQPFLQPFVQDVEGRQIQIGASHTAMDVQ